MAPLRRSAHRPLRSLRAWILHRTPVREKDRVVEVFSREEGRLFSFAPGVRHVSSRRAGHLEPFMETELVVASSARGSTIREARVLQSFPRLRGSLERLALAYGIARLLRDYTGTGVRDSLLYDALLSLIRAADSPGKIPPLLAESAHVHLLRSLGALPDLVRCTHCRRRLRAHAFSWNSTQRGFWCSFCTGKEDPQLTHVVKLLRLFLKRPVPSPALRVSPALQGRLRKLLRTLLHTQAIGKHIRFPQ